MAALFIFLIIAGCVAYLYLKSTLVKSFAMLIIAVCAVIVAFGYFELLAKLLIDRNFLIPWAQPLSFVLLFVVAFAVMQAIAAKLTRQEVDLGFLPERIGCVLCGIFLGFIVASLLLTALAMAPLPNKYPYQRFDERRPNAENPTKVILNADALVPQWFSIVSDGSLSGKRSFAALHSNFIDQAFLNRLNLKDKVSIVTSSEAITVPPKNAAWPAPGSLKDSKDKPISQKAGHELIIVRVGIKNMTLKFGANFTLSQLRLICKQKDDAQNPLAGKAKNIYPVGYLRTAGQLELKQLNDTIKLIGADFDGNVKWLDFAFYVPNDFMPVLVEFKQNAIAHVPPLIAARDAPPPVPFIQMSRCAMDIAELKPIRSAKIHGLKLASGNRFLADLALEVSDPNELQTAQTPSSIRPARFVDEEILCARAELRIEVPPEDTDAPEPRPGPGSRQRREKPEGIPSMLVPRDDYKLLSLKCNNPSTGVAVKGSQLPVLVEISGLIHHPVGVIASGSVGEMVVYEIDYCSFTAEETEQGLIIDEDGSIAQPFPNTVWLTEQVESISEFYVLYLVKAAENTVITSVRPADSKIAAQVKDYDGFLIQ